MGPSELAISLLCGTVLIAACGVQEQATHPIPQPNIIVIVSDDLGYADLGVHGSRQAQTPNIDEIARSGVRFSDAYVTHPSCAPSRAGLLTGRYPHRFVAVNRLSLPRTQVLEHQGVPAEEHLLSEVLKGAGYATAAIGKWHLGTEAHSLPTKRGFDAFFGHLTGGHDYFEWSSGPGGPIYRDTEPVEGSQYLTEAFAIAAVEFIERHKEHPFFLYLAFNAIHSPWHYPPGLAEAFADVGDERRRQVLAMTASLDAAVGRVLTKLHDVKLEQNTLVFFLNDNGGIPSVSSNAPLRGGKRRLYEGGIRVPFFLRWPRHLGAAQVYRQMVSAMDVLPTVLAAAGVGIPEEVELDGVDLLPYLTGEKKGSPHSALFWWQNRSLAVRKGDMKLLLTEKNGAYGKEFYDLARDPGETTNLASHHPELVKELTKAHRSWRSQLGYRRSSSWRPRSKD